MIDNIEKFLVIYNKKPGAPIDMCILIHTQNQKNEASSNAFSKITHQREHIVIPTQFNAIGTKSKHKRNL